MPWAQFDYSLAEAPATRIKWGRVGPSRVGRAEWGWGGVGQLGCKRPWLQG